MISQIFFFSLINSLKLYKTCLKTHILLITCQNFFSWNKILSISINITYCNLIITNNNYIRIAALSCVTMFLNLLFIIKLINEKYQSKLKISLIICIWNFSFYYWKEKTFKARMNFLIFDQNHIWRSKSNEKSLTGRKAS